MQVKYERGLRAKCNFVEDKTTYRLVDEDKLRRLIESDMIYNELCAQGVDNWIGCDFIHYPDTDEIETELNKFYCVEENLAGD